jgi:hypothetical protein
MDVPFSSPGVFFGTLCPIPEGCTTNNVPGGQFGSIRSPHPANGLLLYLPSEDAPVVFVARFGASPRNTLDQGTELPIVHESSFSRTPIHLPYVPLHGDFRTTLRIYAPDAEAGTTVRVELRSWTAPTVAPVEAKIVALPAPPQPTLQPIFPGYAQLDLRGEFPQTFGMAGNCNVTIVPLPRDSGALPRIWAFVTITDNVTQEATLQRPQ